MLPESAHRDTPTRTERLRAALTYAEQGWPVFPCKPGGKAPLTPNGHLDATTAASRIAAWWHRWPDANIGIPTGGRSGILALDVDHPASLDELEAEHGKLPATRTHSTGSGGMHYLYRYPAAENIPNSAGKLGSGLDVRGEGGYIIVPPSATTRPYEVLDKLLLADPPAWLIEDLRQPHRGRDGGAGGITTAITAKLTGPKILEGERDDTLARIAGRLHDGTRTLDQLAADLMAINGARCEPPLPERQVWKVARSIHARPPCKPAPQTTPEVLETLDQLEAVLWRIRWRGMGELSARDVYVALIIIARQYGTRIPAGVRVSVGIRALALAAGVSKPTVIKAIRRLMDAGLIRKDDADRSGTKAGAFVLLKQRATFDHSPTTEHLRGTEKTSGQTLRAPGYAGPLRCSSGSVMSTSAPQSAV